MYMPYSKNPHLPKVRQDAVRLVVKGWSMRKVARRYGVEPSTVSRWVKRDPTGRYQIATKSSRPKKSHQALSDAVVEAIIA